MLRIALQSSDSIKRYKCYSLLMSSMKFINSERYDNLRYLAHQIAEGIQNIEVDKDAGFNSQVKDALNCRALLYDKHLIK